MQQSVDNQLTGSTVMRTGSTTSQRKCPQQQSNCNNLPHSRTAAASASAGWLVGWLAGWLVGCCVLLRAACCCARTHTPPARTHTRTCCRRRAPPDPSSSATTSPMSAVYTTSRVYMCASSRACCAHTLYLHMQLEFIEWMQHLNRIVLFCFFFGGI